MKKLCYLLLFLLSSLNLNAEFLNAENYKIDNDILAPKLATSIQEKVVQDMQSGHGWTKSGAAGTLSDDTTDYILGSQSLKFVTDAAGGSCTARKTGITAFDMTGRAFKIWVKTSNLANTKQMSFYASSDSFTNYYTWNISATVEQLKGLDWVPITLSWTNVASTTGSPNRAAITALQWRVVDQNSSAVTANLGFISSVPENTEGFVSVVFDDGSSTVWSTAKPIMDKYGIKGSVYIIPDYVGWSGQPYMTIAQLQSLQKIGWTIAGHHQTAMTSLSLTQSEAAAKKVKRYLIQNNFKGFNHFALPNGEYDNNILNVFSKYYATIRTSNDYGETYPPADPYRLRVMFIHTATTTAAIATAIDNARTNKDWLILVFHRVVTSPAIDTEYSTANFTTAMADLSSDTISKKTLIEATGL